MLDFAVSMIMAAIVAVIFWVWIFPHQAALWAARFRVAFDRHMKELAANPDAKR
jgi:hypothetical protein